MKQHVLPKQLMEVSKEKLVKVYGDKYGSKLNDYRKDFYNYHHKKFTIGKLIELLNHISHKAIVWDADDLLWRITFVTFDEYDNDIHWCCEDKELVDALWNAVKSTI